MKNMLIPFGTIFVTCRATQSMRQEFSLYGDFTAMKNMLIPFLSNESKFLDKAYYVPSLS